jgi:hypothetical protein
MRFTHRRLLLARGFELGLPVRIRGLVVFQAVDANAARILLIRGKLIGPSWPSINSILDQSGIETKILEMAPYWIIAPDQPFVREVLESAATVARQSHTESVLIPGEGFVPSVVEKKFAPRVFAGPVALLVLSIVLAVALQLSPEDKQQAVEQEPLIDCALDLAPEELNAWVAKALAGESKSESVVIQTELGLLNLEVEQTLGSTQSVSGYLECQDGRTKALQYRLDSSSAGAMVELGEKLNP